MEGKIIKGIAGFYYIHIPNLGIYECKAKGIFRNKKIKPLVGDNVLIDILDEQNKKGNIIDVLERKNTIIRPAVANVDQALIIFAIKDPEPNFNLLDRFLIMMLMQNIETIICFNKIDKVDNSIIERYKEIYKSSNYKMIFTSTYEDTSLRNLKDILKNKTTVLAGPSGVGKSSIMNLLNPNANMETGEISEKIKRGKHTTRHSELINIQDDTYVFDTPGFTSLYIEDLEKDDLKDYFIEFKKYEEKCRFGGCIHINEPDCAVKQALSNGEINNTRYENYLELYSELKDKKKKYK